MPRVCMFNEKQQDFIKSNYPYMSNKKIAEVLGGEFTDKNVKGFADRHKLKKDCLRVYMNQEEMDYIIRWYNKKPTGDIAKHLGYTTKKVNDFAYRKGLKRNIVKYSINDTYFQSIDTPNKAYWLGFLYADGCVIEVKKNGKVRSLALEVGLSKTDEFHLSVFKMSLSSNAPIKYKVVDNKYEACRVSFCNTNLCKDLINLGCVPRKSLILKFPSEYQVPKDLQKHFIRGYFDGDGCVFHNEDTRKNGSDLCSLSFVGTEEFLVVLQDVVFNELGLTKTAIRQKKDNQSYQCAWGGKSNIETWFQYLYSDEDIIYLQRKRDKFVNILA